MESLLKFINYLLTLITTLFHEAGHAISGFIVGMVFGNVWNVFFNSFSGGMVGVIMFPINYIISRFITLFQVLPKVTVGLKTDGLTYTSAVGGFIFRILTVFSGYSTPVIVGPLLLFAATTEEIQISFITSLCVFGFLLICGIIGLIYSIFTRVMNREGEIGWVQIPLAIVLGGLCWITYFPHFVWDTTDANDAHIAFRALLILLSLVLLVYGTKDNWNVLKSIFLRDGRYAGNDFDILSGQYFGSSLVWAIVYLLLFIPAFGIELAVLIPQIISST